MSVHNGVADPPSNGGSTELLTSFVILKWNKQSSSAFV